eukprot:TRINITY_DN20285_c1_g1_i1.p1 TRINITY_DN20285_c1_g1~~TRINITY_DN20285_c1_g1_i1.p1  ORF type:complete len:812 (+),score=165.11 TRINITY_DN20285_c1_g1_i1:205-2640(+)
MEVNSGDSRVRVFARVRPANRGEQKKPCVHLSEKDRTVRILSEVETPAWVDGAQAGAPQTEAQQFIFDGVFAEQASQEDVFALVGRPVLRECLLGFNGTVFAYGQTGSGKTHSLLHVGSGGDDAGIMPRMMSELFDAISRDETSNYEVDAAAMQVYNEAVDDLLHAGHNTGGGRSVNVLFSGEVTDLTWVKCGHVSKLRKAFARARKNLIYAETKMNKASSRSHAIFQIRIRKDLRAGETTIARLSIVDLAGSERVKKSGVEGAQFKEAIAINNSLLTLGNVVSALAGKKTFVPYRDSKLTHILSPSIGANCKTTLLVCASPAPEHAVETASSLKFASRAMQVAVNAHVNRVVEPLPPAPPPREPSSACEGMESDVEDSPCIRKTMEDAVERAEQAEAESRQAIEVAAEREQKAQERVVLAEETTAIAEERAEQAEIRVREACARAENAEAKILELEERVANAERLAVDRAAREQDRVTEAATEKAREEAREEARAQAELAEQDASAWKEKHRQALLQIAHLEDKVAELTRELQQRSASLDEVTSKLNKHEAEMGALEAELQKEVAEAQQASEEARIASVNAAQLEAESQQARAEAVAMQARASREASQLSDERAHHEILAKRRMAAIEEVEKERQHIAAQQESLVEQQRVLQQRLAHVDGLEAEKRAMAKKQMELVNEVAELRLLERRVRNSLGTQASGPPVRAQAELKSLDERRNASKSPGPGLPTMADRGVVLPGLPVSARNGVVPQAALPRLPQDAVRRGSEKKGTIFRAASANILMQTPPATTASRTPPTTGQKRSSSRPPLNAGT